MLTAHLILDLMLSTLNSQILRLQEREIHAQRVEIRQSKRKSEADASERAKSVASSTGRWGEDLQLEEEAEKLPIPDNAARRSLFPTRGKDSPP